MNEETRRAIRFILVGASSTTLYFLLLWGLRGAIPSTAILTAVCYGASMVYNFLAQGLWTFRTNGLSHRHLGRYSVMQGCALIANSAAMTGLVDLAGMPLFASQIVVTISITAVVYVLSKVWVYR